MNCIPAKNYTFFSFKNHFDQPNNHFINIICNNNKNKVKECELTVSKIVYTL
eukprot:GAHX01008360.1.p1 GENE.GAHX01008360.1~~GAHX01008360.1.p1  ORF type:complete len:52 (-),score=9.55 GAHX01008360.1:147-302(-)